MAFKIRMLEAISGPNMEYQAGDELTESQVTEAEAERFVKAGIAEYVTEEAPEEAKTTTSKAKK